MHGQGKFTFCLVGAEDVRKNIVLPTKGLLPAVGSFAHRILQVGPELPIVGIRVMDVAGDAHRALAAEVSGRSRCVSVAAIVSVEKLKCDAAIEQSAQSSEVRL